MSLALRHRTIHPGDVIRNMIETAFLTAGALLAAILMIAVLSMSFFLFNAD